MRALCPCGRAERGFMFLAPRHKRRQDDTMKPQWFCSIRCLDGRDDMKDATKDELAAIEVGGQCGGEYLDEIGKTDLATLSKAEWSTFLRCVVGGYVADMQKRIKAPF